MDDAVALVEEADDGDPVGHRGHTDLLTRCERRCLRTALLGGRLLFLPAAAAEQQH
jgi:hypothetical protein